MATAFVDREDSLHLLRARVRDLVTGRGGALVVEGGSGMGKSTLLDAFAREVREAADGGVGGGAVGPCRVVHVRCAPGAGPSDPFRPVLSALLTLQGETRSRGWWQEALATAARSTPAFLALLVPGLDRVLELGRDITEAALRSGTLPGDSLLPQQESVASAVAEALLAEARRGAPVLLLVDDVQYIDLSSLHVLELLVGSLSREPLSLVLGHSTHPAVPDGNGLHHGSAVASLIERWEGGGALTRHQLGGLPEEAVAELVRLRLPGVAFRPLSARVREATSGTPIFVEQCLRLLGRQSAARAADAPLPAKLPQAIHDRFHRLDPGVREMLFVAATHGQTFLSRAVAEVVGAPHEDVMEALRHTSREHGLVRPQDEPPRWARWLRSDLYTFEHRALQEGIYAEQSAEQRRGRHARLAEVLTALAAEAGPDGVPLELRLDIAGQLRRGGPQCQAASAAAHYELARSAAVDGLSYAQAERHCATAIEAARELPGGAERDRLVVRSVELLLSLTEVRWQGHAERPGELDIDGLAILAEEAAHRLADPRLVARTTLLRGKTLLATQGLQPSLEKLREAVERARESEDPAALFVARVELGRQLPKADLAAGLAELFEAERLYATDPRLGDARDPVLQHSRNLNEMQLGVNLFDSGRLGEARGRLLRCVGRLRGEPLRAELPIALNYVAQLHLATGEAPEAERVLREALAFEEERGGESGWHAYNTALLALLRAREPERAAEALALAEEAWAETQRTWLANLVPIVRNLYAEVLLTTAPALQPAPATHSSEGSDAALERAERLARDTCVETRGSAETRGSGMVRSEIAALTLLSRIQLRRGRGNPTAAADYARRAVRRLRQVGDMPALRTEEVLYHAARALRADGAHGEARELLAEARGRVERKAESIADPALRHRFRTEEPLNARVLAADSPR